MSAVEYDEGQKLQPRDLNTCTDAEFFAFCQGYAHKSLGLREKLKRQLDALEAKQPV